MPPYFFKWIFIAAAAAAAAFPFPCAPPSTATTCQDSTSFLAFGSLPCGSDTLDVCTALDQAPSECPVRQGKEERGKRG